MAWTTTTTVSLTAKTRSATSLTTALRPAARRRRSRAARASRARQSTRPTPCPATIARPWTSLGQRRSTSSWPHQPERSRLRSQDCRPTWTWWCSLTLARPTSAWCSATTPPPSRPFPAAPTTSWQTASRATAVPTRCPWPARLRPSSRHCPL